MKQFTDCSEREAQLKLQIQNQNVQRDERTLELQEQEKSKGSGGWVSTAGVWMKDRLKDAKTLVTSGSFDDAGLTKIRAALKTSTENLAKQRIEKSKIEDDSGKVQVWTAY
jgi:hypothetical protein